MQIAAFHIMSSHCFNFNRTTSFFPTYFFCFPGLQSIANHVPIHLVHPICFSAAYLEKLHHIYGPVVRIWLSSSRLLVSVKDSDLSKLVLISARDRPPSTLNVPLPATTSMVFASEREVSSRAYTERVGWEERESRGGT